MKKFSFRKLIFEQGILKTTKNKVLVNAIVNRHPITFWYAGPRKEVKAGRRIKGEPVALGLSKRGNLIIRTFVQPPSVSKKGFEKHGWRTFMVGRMSNIEIHEDETFDVKRDKYSEGDDGSMTVTYVTTDWSNTKKVTGEPQQPEPTEPEQEVRPEPQTPEEPQDVRPEPQTEPQDRPEVPEKPKPPVSPEQITKDFTSDVYGRTIQNKVQDIDGQKSINISDYEDAVKQLYDLKRNEWINHQREIGGNTSPGEGTRKRLQNDSKIEIDNKLNNDNITVINQLQENIRRIKHLML